MRLCLVRSLQLPDILLTHWRVYNSIANTSKGVLFLSPSDVYVRSFLCLLYTLIKLHYTKALSDQASSLALGWILLLWKPRILASLHDSTTTFQCYKLFSKSVLFTYFLRWEYQTTWSASWEISWEICMQVRKQQLELDMEQHTGSK